MRLIVARCTVDYTGRLTAHLPEALRLLMIKADGAVLVAALVRSVRVPAEPRLEPAAARA